MTVEHRFQIGLADIVAVTCECKACGVRVSTAPAKLKVANVRRCPTCGAEWVNDETVRMQHAFESAGAQLLFALAATTADPDAFGCRLTFEVAAPK